MMQAAIPEVNHSVRLIKDIPELGLHSGEVGIVRSMWFAPSTAYEVEFTSAGRSSDHAMRALLLAHQIMCELKN
jgi:hypothetical protein